MSARRKATRAEHRPLVGVDSVCSGCGKMNYLTRKAAKLAISRLKGRTGRLNAYRCPSEDGEGLFHVGHPPADLTSGKKARSELNAAAPREQRRPKEVR